MTLNAVIDLSHYNNVTDFNAVKADDIVGIIHKATEGVNLADPEYLARRSQALAAGLWWGAYHFGTNDDGVAQAEYFLSIVNPGPTDLLVLDFEMNPTGPSMSLAVAEAFLTHV